VVSKFFDTIIDKRAIDFDQRANQESVLRKDLSQNKTDRKIVFEVQFQDILGVFETDDKEKIFAKFMKEVAKFFLKNEDEVFLRNDRGHIILKNFVIWETLVPFEYSKIKDRIPRLELVLIGDMKETELVSDK